MIGYTPSVMTNSTTSRRAFFEAFPSARDGTFFTHHSLKVSPEDDIQLVEVIKERVKNRYRIIKYLLMPEKLWTAVTNPDEIVDWLCTRNKRHLQQSDIEGGISAHPAMQALRANYGFNDTSRRVLDGDIPPELELSPLMTEWFKTLKQTEQEKQCTPVLGVITSEEFMEMFKKADEKTSSDPRTLNYTIWKAMARSKYISSFASVLISLPFMYGFAHGYLKTQ